MTDLLKVLKVPQYLLIKRLDTCTLSEFLGNRRSLSENLPKWVVAYRLSKLNDGLNFQFIGPAANYVLNYDSG
jgi:hypothetical protein